MTCVSRNVACIRHTIWSVRIVSSNELPKPYGACPRDPGWVLQKISGIILADLPQHNSPKTWESRAPRLPHSWNTRTAIQTYSLIISMHKQRTYIRIYCATYPGIAIAALSWPAILCNNAGILRRRTKPPHSRLSEYALPLIASVAASRREICV